MISKKSPIKTMVACAFYSSACIFLLLFFHFLIWIDTYKIMEWVVGLAHIQASTFSLALSSQDHGRLSVERISRLSRGNKLVHTCWTSWFVLEKRTEGELWAQLLPSPSVADGSHSRETCTHISTP